MQVIVVPASVVYTLQLDDAGVLRNYMAEELGSGPARGSVRLRIPAHKLVAMAEDAAYFAREHDAAPGDMHGLACKSGAKRWAERMLRQAKGAKPA